METRACLGSMGFGTTTDWDVKGSVNNYTNIYDTTCKNAESGHLGPLNIFESRHRSSTNSETHREHFLCTTRFLTLLVTSSLPWNSFAEAGCVCACLEDRFINPSAESLVAPTQIVDHTNHPAYYTNLEIAKALCERTHAPQLNDRSHMRAGARIFKASFYIGWNNCSSSLKPPQSSEHQTIPYFVACVLMAARHAQRLPKPWRSSTVT